MAQVLPSLFYVYAFSRGLTLLGAKHVKTLKARSSKFSKIGPRTDLADLLFTDFWAAHKRLNSKNNINISGPGIVPGFSGILSSLQGLQKCCHEIFLESFSLKRCMEVAKGLLGQGSEKPLHWCEMGLHRCQTGSPWCKILLGDLCSLDSEDLSEGAFRRTRGSWRGAKQGQKGCSEKS